MITRDNVDYNSINLMNSYCGEILFNGNSIFLPIFNIELLNNSNSNKEAEYINFCYFEFLNASNIKCNQFKFGEGQFNIKTPEEIVETKRFYFGATSIRNKEYFELEIDSSKFLLHIPKTSIIQKSEFKNEKIEGEIEIINKINMV